MTNEQIEKEAIKYALLVCEDDAHLMYECAIKDWKAGYHFRDKEVEELRNAAITRSNIATDRLNELYKEVEELKAEVERLTKIK